jgi:inosine-uridine nucleoside N-ribohydrolase
MVDDRKRANPRLPILCLALVVVVVGAVLPGASHEEEQRNPVVIDTDLGIDDAVALAMALQSSDLNIAALVTTNGVSSPSSAVQFLAGILDFFNRTEVSVYRGPDATTRAVPECRDRAQSMLAAAIPGSQEVSAEPFSPDAYVVDGQRTTVAVLGPLTQLAAAFTARPELVKDVARVVAACDPDDESSWNCAFDPGAVGRLRSSGVDLVFVRANSAASKTADWFAAGPQAAQATALGETFVARLLQNPADLAHYVEELPRFHDELVVLYLVRPELFEEVSPEIVQPRPGADIAAAVASLLAHGRQRKDRVVFINGALPADILQEDVRDRREAILANNGEDEWFAQLLLNELHEHLGAYSIIGVKMGLRAAELLNAPQHSMEIVSFTPSSQPVSCLNDGLMVATGSTPGRNLFRQVAGSPGTVKAAFSFNGRTITLQLKVQYRVQIRTAIGDLRSRYTLEDEGYWDGVRGIGLDIWENWNRGDLFEVVSSMTPSPENAPGEQ